jgi:hypothetical protein
MLSKAKFYGEGFSLASGPLRRGHPRGVDISAYTPSTGPLVAADDFTAADGTNLTARGWTAGAGSTWAVSGNRATKTGGTGQDVVYRPCAANGVLTVTAYVTGGGDNVGVVFNVGGGKYWLVNPLFGSMALYYFDGATFTSKASSGAPSTTTVSIEVTINGDNVKVKLNGTQYINFTESGRANQTATGAGLRDFGTPDGSGFDDFAFNALPGLFLPSRQINYRTPMPPGGPYFYLRNAGSNTVPLYQDTGALLANCGPNTVTSVVLGTSKWWAYQDVLGTAKPVADNGASVRTVPIGYLGTTPASPVPTSYDPITCDGGWRRARSCASGGLMDIWMATDEVTPHFVDGVAVFKFNGNCYYFKASDKETLGHGFSLTADQVTWYADCDACTNGDGGGDTGPVPCTVPDAVKGMSFSVAWHNKVRLDAGPAGYGVACAPTCESNLSATVSDPAGIANWSVGGTNASVPSCGGGPGIQVNVYHQNLGDGTCCWEAQFSQDDSPTCYSLFRKYTGTSPAGSGWVQVYPAPWACGGDGDTHQYCTGTGLDAISSVVVS